MTYMSIQEAAEKWGISLRCVQQMCRAGAINGAVKEGRLWRIPENAMIMTQRCMTAVKEKRPLPVGISGYIEAVTNYYYVDKTLLIRDFIDSLSKVSLFTRPRRFGKTLNMDMLRVYFEYTEGDTSVYFQDKAIWRCGDKYRAYQGKYPVIYLSFKDVKYSTWENALKSIAFNIRTEYARHGEFVDSASCNAVEKEAYQTIISGRADEVLLSSSLALLSAMLHKHYVVEAIIAIDEYDTPIQQGYSYGYYDEAISFIRNLFSGAFKDNPDLAYGFMTGILRVAKESIFSGMNNLKVNTIMEDRYSQYFGFTMDEVCQMLRDYGYGEKVAEVCEWYDGYQFDSTEIFNQWSVINYVDEHCYPKAYWQSTGSNEIIGQIISEATPEITENLRRLMQGESITTYIDTGVIYPEVKRKPSSIYSFLLMTGYLRNTEIIPQNDGNFMCWVSVPNKEIAYVFAKEVISKLPSVTAESTAIAIQQAIFERNTKKLQCSIENYLVETISSFDGGNEAFYQGLMIGLCAILNNRYIVRSNRESGLGRFDLQLEPLDRMLPGFIFELKASRKDSDVLDALAKEALKQIDQMRYETEMRSRGIHEILKIGIAFRGKDVRIIQQ